MDKKAKRILIVDDNEDIRTVIGAALRDYRTAFANDGEQALEALAAEPPDLMVLDIMMPKLDGFGLLARIRQDPELKYLKVLILSAKGLPEDQLEGYRLGALDYVPKPFKSDVVRAKVERLLQLRFAEEVGAYKQGVMRYLDDSVGNLLNVLGASSEILRDIELPEAGRSCAEIFREGVTGLQQLMDDLRILTDLTTRPRPLDTVNLTPVIEEGARRAEATAAETHAIIADPFDPSPAPSVRLALPEDPEPFYYVRGDAELLSQAVHNVTLTSLQRTAGQGEVTVALRQDVADVVVTVSDTGEAIPEDLLPTLFQPLYCPETFSALGGPAGLQMRLPLAALIARVCGGTLDYRRHRERNEFRFAFRFVGTTPPSERESPEALMTS